MTTNPSCYIHCSNGIGYVRPCPRGLTWNVEIDACDWLDMPETVVVPPVPQQPSLISYGSYSGAQQNAYGRKKRSTTERKKRFMPFLPEFLDPIRSKAVIGNLDLILLISFQYECYNTFDVFICRSKLAWYCSIARFTGSNRFPRSALSAIRVSNFTVLFSITK